MTNGRNGMQLKCSFFMQSLAILVLCVSSFHNISIKAIGRQPSQHEEMRELLPEKNSDLINIRENFRANSKRPSAKMCSERVIILCNVLLSCNTDTLSYAIENPHFGRRSVPVRLVHSFFLSGPFRQSKANILSLTGYAPIYIIVLNFF